MAQESRSVLKQINYEIFIVILTILSWLNGVLLFFFLDSDSRIVVIFTERFLTIFFLLDFLYRLNKADSKSTYFKKYGWLDLIGSLPFLRFFRAYRVYRTIQYISKIRGRRFFREFFANRAETAALTLILAVIFLFEFASIFILRAESASPEANIETASDAVWWVLVTVATVGYGDMYPVTDNGRFIAIFVIIAGVGLFGVLSGFLTRNFLGSPSDIGSKRKEIGSDDTDLQMTQLLAEMQALKQQNAEARAEQESATQELRQRLIHLESLLEQKTQED